MDSPADPLLAIIGDICTGHGRDLLAEIEAKKKRDAEERERLLEADEEDYPRERRFRADPGSCSGEGLTAWERNQ